MINKFAYRCAAEALGDRGAARFAAIGRASTSSEAMVHVALYSHLLRALPIREHIPTVSKRGIAPKSHLIGLRSAMQRGHRDDS